MAAEKVVKKSKAEKRLARKAAREEKRVSQAASVDDSKRVGQAIQPAETKKAPVSGEPVPLDEQLMKYAEDLHDKEGAWSWGVKRDWGEKTWTEVLKPALDGFSKRRWREIRADQAGGHHKHHEYEIHLICDEAFKRLAILELDDQDHIFRFRLNGQSRLYGFLFADVFKTVWYDPTHQIYPVQLGGLKTRERTRKTDQEDIRKAAHKRRKLARQKAKGIV